MRKEPKIKIPKFLEKDKKTQQIILTIGAIAILFLLAKRVPPSPLSPPPLLPPPSIPPPPLPSILPVPPPSIPPPPLPTRYPREVIAGPYGARFRVGPGATSYRLTGSVVAGTKFKVVAVQIGEMVKGENRWWLTNWGVYCWVGNTLEKPTESKKYFIV